MAAGDTCDLGKAGVLVIHGKKGIELPNGMFLKYPNLRKVLNEETNKYEYVYDNKRGKSVTLTRMYGGKLVENICQALARRVIGEQLSQVAAKDPVVLTVHDSIAFLAPADEWEEGLRFASACMRTTPAWAVGLPLTCEVGYGASYSDAGKKKPIEAWEI
jgi:DNA polymerase